MLSLVNRVGRRPSRAIVLAALLAAVPTICHGADDLDRTRIGFSSAMLFGLSTGFSSLPEEQRQVDGGRLGLGIELALGGFVTDQVSLHWSGHAHYLFAESGSTIAGLSGPRITYFMERSAPSWYGSATLGLSSVQVLSGASDSAAIGGGASFALGYEFKQHGVVEFEVTTGLRDPGDPHDDIGEHGSVVILTLSVGSIGYR